MNPADPINLESVAPPAPQGATRKHWRVEVSTSGEQIVAIEPEMLAGQAITPEFEGIIENCALHLLSFIGRHSAPAAPAGGQPARGVAKVARTQTEWLEHFKPRNPQGPNGRMFEELRKRLRREVDEGEYDGYAPDLLHHEAAAAIEDLIVALDSQIDICNSLRASPPVADAAGAQIPRFIYDLIRKVERARDLNTGHEPSLSVFYSAVDELLGQVIWHKTPAGQPQDRPT